MIEAFMKFGICTVFSVRKLRIHFDLTGLWKQLVNMCTCSIAT